MEAYSHLAAVYDKLMDDVDYDAWAAYIDGFIEMKSAVIFEAACGTGSLSYRFCQKRHKVIAADVSEDMLRIAAAKARHFGCSVTFIKQNMGDIRIGNAVDAVVSACDGPNYLDGDGLRHFIEGSYAALNQRGVLLFDISTRAKLAAMDGQVFFDDDDDLTCIWQNAYNQATHKLCIDVTLFIREDGLFKKQYETHTQYAHSISDIICIVQQTGFSHVQVFDCFSRRRYTAETQRAQFVCRK